MQKFWGSTWPFENAPHNISIFHKAPYSKCPTPSNSILKKLPLNIAYSKSCFPQGWVHSSRATHIHLSPRTLHLQMWGRPACLSSFLLLPWKWCPVCSLTIILQARAHPRVCFLGNPTNDNLLILYLASWRKRATDNKEVYDKHPQIWGRQVSP